MAVPDLLVGAEGVEVVEDGAEGDLHVLGDFSGGPAVEASAQDHGAARGWAVGLGVVGAFARELADFVRTGPARSGSVPCANNRCLGSKFDRTGDFVSVEKSAGEVGD